MNEAFAEWVDILLQRYRLRSIAELTADMISEEIGDARASISNENLWALGAPTEASAAMHLSSSETLREYILFLQNLLQFLKWLCNHLLETVMQHRIFQRKICATLS